MRQTDIAVGRSADNEPILGGEERVDGRGATGQVNPHGLAGPADGSLTRRGVEWPTALLAESIVVGVAGLAGGASLHASNYAPSLALRVG